MNYLAKKSRRYIMTQQLQYNLYTGWDIKNRPLHVSYGPPCTITHTATNAIHTCLSTTNLLLINLLEHQIMISYKHISYRRYELQTIRLQFV